MRQDGFTLVEMLVALFLLALCLLGVVPLFISASRATASAAEISVLSAVADRRMELLRQTDFATLTAGGNLNLNQTGFFDNSDPDYLVRWRVVDDATPPTMKTLEVWARADRTPVGLPKQITLSGVRAQ